VTNLADYRTAHSRRAASIARHPSSHQDDQDDAVEDADR
jgi:hypothetical protein